MSKYDARLQAFYDEEALYDPEKVTRVLLNGQHVDVEPGSFTEKTINFETPIKDELGRDRAGQTHGTSLEMFSFIDPYNDQRVIGKTSTIDAMWVDDHVKPE